MCKFLLLHRAFRRITLIINQQMHSCKIQIKTFKIAPTCLQGLVYLCCLGTTLFLAKVILKTFTNYFLHINRVLWQHINMKELISECF